MHVWVDGCLLADPTAPALRVDDHGLVVGDGVFEAVKVVDGRPFALDRPDEPDVDLPAGVRRRPAWSFVSAPASPV